MALTSIHGKHPDYCPDDEAYKRIVIDAMEQMGKQKNARKGPGVGYYPDADRPGSNYNTTDEIRKTEIDTKYGITIFAYLLIRAALMLFVTLQTNHTTSTTQPTPLLYRLNVRKYAIYH